MKHTVGPQYENIAAVTESVEEHAGLCISRRSLELGTPQTSLHGIYEVQLAQVLQPSHASNETIALSRVISRRGDRNCPPKCYDLTSCDFFLKAK